MTIPVSSLTNDCYLQTSVFRFIVHLAHAIFDKPLILKLYPRFKKLCFSCKPKIIVFFKPQIVVDKPRTMSHCPRL